MTMLPISGSILAPIIPRPKVATATNTLALPMPKAAPLK